MFLCSLYCNLTNPVVIEEPPASYLLDLIFLVFPALASRLRSKVLISIDTPIPGSCPFCALYLRIPQLPPHLQSGAGTVTEGHDLSLVPESPRQGYHADLGQSRGFGDTSREGHTQI